MILQLMKIARYIDRQTGLGTERDGNSNKKAQIIYHGIGFPRASLPVRKNSCIVSAQSGLHQRPNALLIDSLLRICLRQ